MKHLPDTDKRPAWPAPDWSLPWFAPWAAVGTPCLRRIAEGWAVHQALTEQAAPACLPRFVPADALPPGEAYESFVHARQQVPTRDNAHDFFNGLAWCLYPRAKALLNRLQAEAIARDGIGPRRGPLRDAVTLLDENGAILSAPPALHAALRERDWQGLFVGHRQLWRQARLWLFGHALAEQLLQPRKDLTAHVLCAPAGLAAPSEVDGWLASSLDVERLSSRPFSPLPVLGVPGWWPANEAPAFYADARVFRPARR